MPTEHYANITSIVLPISPRSPPCDSLNGCRSVPNIVFSCASTIFLCTWVALHPNVPRYPWKPKWKRLLERMSLMILALLAPEVVLLWASSDWASCCNDLKQKNMADPTCTWTETHAMLAHMDGLRLVSENGERLADKLTLVPPDVVLPTVDEIQDKSKRDDIAKGITLIQTLWFAIQAIYRVSQHLDVTELEVTTIGHVVLNVFIYFLWWNKPSDIRFPIEVQVGRRENRQNQPTDVEAQARVRELPLRVRMGVALDEFMGDRQPTSWRTQVYFFGLYTVGGTFGAIHCLAWNSPFPTHLEHILWRISAVLVTALPGLSVAVILTSLALGLKGALAKIFAIFEVLIIVFYPIARICLLILAVTTLRDLPRTAYETPSWSLYIPHIA